MTVVDRVRDLVEPVIDGEGLELVDIEHGGGLLRIYLDRPGGIDLEAITSATEVISALLDHHDPVPGTYTLEVSSPGLERPLKTPDHFQRVVGSRVSIRTHETVDGERRFAGTLTAADADGIDVVADDGPTRRLAYDDIERARTVFEWGPAPKPGKSGKKKRATTS